VPGRVGQDGHDVRSPRSELHRSGLKAGPKGTDKIQKDCVDAGASTDSGACFRFRPAPSTPRRRPPRAPRPRSTTRSPAAAGLWEQRDRVSGAV
jgi:hypothetical protein